MLFDSSVLDGVRWRPACTSRRDASGTEVRRDRRVVRFEIEVEDGTVMGIMSPERFLMKICMVSIWRSGDADRDEAVDDGADILLKRI